jgi:hypothetical protein
MSADTPVIIDLNKDVRLEWKVEKPRVTAMDFRPSARRRTRGSWAVPLVRDAGRAPVRARRLDRRCDRPAGKRAYSGCAVRLPQ